MKVVSDKEVMSFSYLGKDKNLYLISERNVFFRVLVIIVMSMLSLKTFSRDKKIVNNGVGL